MTYLFPELGVGSKDADMVTNELIVHNLHALNGDQILSHVLDNWSGNKNRCTALGYPQYMVDLKIVLFNLIVLRYPHDSKDACDRSCC